MTDPLRSAYGRAVLTKKATLEYSYPPVPHTFFTRSLDVCSSSIALKPYGSATTTLTVTCHAPGTRISQHSSDFSLPSAGVAVTAVAACEELELCNPAARTNTHPRAALVQPRIPAHAVPTMVGPWATVAVAGCTVEVLTVRNVCEDVVITRGTIGKLNFACGGASLTLVDCAIAEANIFDCGRFTAQASAFGSWFYSPRCRNRAIIMNRCIAGPPNRASCNLTPSDLMVQGKKTPLEEAEGLRPRARAALPNDEVLAGRVSEEATTPKSQDKSDSAPRIPTFTFDDFAELADYTPEDS